MDRRDVTIAFLAAMLSMTVSAGLVSISASPGEYNPWMDIDDNGIINMLDLYKVAQLYGTTGTPITKASIDYDSGWIDITDKCGQVITVTHNLGTNDVMIDIQGKRIFTGSPHQIRYGCTPYRTSWSRSYGGTNHDNGTCVIKTTDGGYAISGCTNSYGSGNSDIWLIKLDWAGSLLWRKEFGGAGVDRGHRLIQTSDGGYAIAGCHDTGGSLDMWLIKTDSNGNFQWDSDLTLGLVGYDTGYSLIQTSDGGYAIVGHTQEYYKAILAKTDSAGNLEFAELQTLYGSGSDTHPHSVVQTSDGGYMIGGFAKSGPVEDWDFVLYKTTPLGIVEWFRSYGGAEDDCCLSMVQTRDGGFALAGITYSFGLSTNNFYLVKTDASGNEEWSGTYGPTDEDQNDLMAGVTQTFDLGYALVGYRYMGTDNYDLFLVKTDRFGNKQFDRTYGGPKHEKGTSVIELNDGGQYVMAGCTQSFAAGGYDCYFVMGETEEGLGLTAVTSNEAYLWRGFTDTYWNYVRVRLWKPKP